MIKNYFIIAWRNLTRNKLNSFISIFGLAVGLTCCILIALFVTDELSYDRNFNRSGDLYRMATGFLRDNVENRNASSSSPYGPTLRTEYPEVDLTTRIFVSPNEDKYLFTVNSNNQLNTFYKDKGFYVDSTFFDMFNFPFLAGDPHTALRNPNTVVITEDLANTLFGNTNVLNKQIKINSSNGEIDYNITGVLKKTNHRSHIEANFFMSIYSGGVGQYINQPNDYATNNIFYTYLRLKPTASAEALEKKLPAFVEKYAGKELKQYGFWKRLFLQPVVDIHLKSDLGFDFATNSKSSLVYIFVCVAVFILLIACINFMNLATARSAKRAAEVGIRKVCGADRKYLIRQFIGESVFISFLALLLSIFLCAVLIKPFNAVTGKDLAFGDIFRNGYWALCLLLTILAGFLAGTYPAFYLSSFNPIQVLKSRFTNKFSVVQLRKGLVVFQFIISIALILSIVIISRQLNFMRNQELGFKKDQELIIPLRNTTAKGNYLPMKNALRVLPGVQSVAGTTTYPGIPVFRDMGFYTEGKSPKDAQIVKLEYTDADYDKTLGLKIIAGRYFSSEFPADTTFGRLVLNEEAVQQLGFTPATAIGKPLFFDFQGQSNRFEIIGVVKNHHFESLHAKIRPFGFIRNRFSYNYILVNVSTTQLGSLIKQIESSWKEFNTNEPFEYSFLDQEFQRNYSKDDRTFSVIGYFTLVAILLSCLGLFGLSVYAAEQRTKEIGIRKVLGASVSGIVGLLSRDFLVLVAIAVVIASPLAWWAMNKWLEDFAYRTQISWWIFAVAGVIALLIALLTVSFQAIKAAIANPVKSLRTE